MSTRNLILIVVTTMIATWGLAYCVWVSQPTLNTMEEQLRLVALVVLLGTAILQVGILAWPFVSRLIALARRKAP